MNMKASFIMPTYNRVDILEVAIPLLQKQNVPDNEYEIIVVNDGPDETARAYFEKLNATNVIFSELENRRGPSAARNRAISLASGRILVFVDDDSLVQENFLLAHLQHHEGRNDIVVSGPIIDVQTIPDINNPPAVRFYHWHTNSFPTGNSSVSKARFDKTEGFDEEFRLYGWEDPEMFMRLNVPKLTRRFEMSAPIYHYKPHVQTHSLAYQLRREIQRGRNGLRYYRKHPSFAVGFQTKQMAIFHALDRLANRFMNLDEKMRAAIEDDWQTTSSFVHNMLIFHAEITAGGSLDLKDEL